MVRKGAWDFVLIYPRFLQARAARLGACPKRVRGMGRIASRWLAGASRRIEGVQEGNRRSPRWRRNWRRCNAGGLAGCSADGSSAVHKLLLRRHLPTECRMQNAEWRI